MASELGQHRRRGIVGLIGFFVLMILVPLTVFSPQLFRAKMRGLSEYGALATSYVRDFEEKWVLGGAREETILGTADIQSLADLANSYAVVSAMRLVPFALGDAIILVGTTAMPLLPLLLTTMSADELLSRLVKLVF